MKQLVLFSYCLLILLKLNSQTPSFEWVKQTGGPAAQSAFTIAVDLTGNIYTTGWFTGTADFDPGTGIFNLTAVGNNDIFVLKLDPYGDFIWAKSFGGSADDIGQEIIVDNSGNVYTTGRFQGAVDFDPGAGVLNLTSSGLNDIFISKFDSLGNLIWAKTFGGSLHDDGRSLAFDLAGNLYTTGEFSDTVDFNPGTGIFNLIASGYNDMFILKLDVLGNFVWAKRVGGNDTNFGGSIAINSQGIYIVGAYAGTADFDPGPGVYNLTSAGIEDIFVLKLDVAGNYAWAKSVGGINYDGGISTALDQAGNIYTTGAFMGTADFDTGPGILNMTSSGGGDIFVLKLDSLGNFGWAKKMGGVGDDDGYFIAVDSSGNVYTTGFFNNTVDFDPNAGTYNLTSAGMKDIFISKLDPAGNFAWAKRMGSTADDAGGAIAVDLSGNVFTVGYFNTTVDFDPDGGIFNLTSGGGSDVFIHKMNIINIGIDEADNKEYFQIYPNPSTGLFNLNIEKGDRDLVLEIYNCLGTLIAKKVVNEQLNTINLSMCPKGLYFIKVLNENVIVGSTKIIKE
jgi:hypothetical protein